MNIFKRWTRRSTLHHANHVTLELNHATVAYDDGTLGLSDCTLRFNTQDASNCAIIGFNGSGKSTLIRLLANQLDCVQGSYHVLADGQPVNLRKRHALTGLVSVVDDTAFPTVLTQAATIEEGLQDYLNTYGLDASDITARIGNVFHHCDLTAYRNQPCSTLDGVHRHLLAIALAMSTQPCLLLADEPARGCDEHDSAIIRKTLQSCPIPVIFTTHDIHGMISDDDRVIILSNTHVIADTTAEQARQRYDQMISEQIQSIRNARSTADNTASI